MKAKVEGGNNEMVSITNSMDMNLSKLREIVKVRYPGLLQFMGSQRIGHNLVTEPETAMATHSSTLAWKIPWMEEPG